jgi:hypothetical protein
MIKYNNGVDPNKTVVYLKRRGYCPSRFPG